MATFNTNNSNDRFTLRLTVTQQSQSVANNTTTLSYSLDLIANTAWNFEQFKIGRTVSINGSIVYSIARSSSASLSIADYGTLNLASGTMTVTHDEDGTKSIEVAYSIDMASADYAPGALSGSGTMTLTTIPRASSLTASNGTLGTAQTLNISRASSAFTHSLSYSCGTLTNQTAGLSNSSGIGTSCTFTPPIDLAKQNTAGKSVSITFTLTTYNGSSWIGSKTKEISCTIPENSSTKPSFDSWTVSPNNDAIPSSIRSTFSGMYIQGKSKVSVATAVSGKYNATISSITTTVDGKAYSGTSALSAILSSSGNKTISTELKDSRGINNKKEATISVYAYSKPTVVPISEEIKCYRSDSDGTANDESNKIWIKVKKSYSSLNGKNSCTLQWRYKLASETWGNQTWHTLTTGDSYDALISGYTFPITNAYTIQIGAVDTLTEHSETDFDIPTADVTLHLGDGGKSVGIGRYADTSVENSLKIAYDTYFEGNVYGLPSVAPVSDTNGYTLPTASTSTLGGVKIDGSSITISNGVISAKQQSTITHIATYAAGTAATSCSFKSANYDFLLMGLTPSTSGAICCVAIPSACVGTAFQVADETNYCKWELSASGLSRTSGAGNIRYIYGIKL